MRTPNFRLDGGAAVVTGAAGGIGARVALGLAASGADVACIDLSAESLQETVTEIRDGGGRAVAIAADTTDHDQMTAAIATAQAELGPVRYAANCAGINDGAPAEEMPLEQWRRLIDVNLTGVFIACQLEGRAMLEAGGGSIVNIGSISASIANRGLTQAHYNSSKAGVIHLSKSLAMEWAHRGVRVNSISPGYTATPMNTRPEVADQVRQFEADTPVGRMATVDEMVGPAVFLLSDAASFCTGVDLLVDGGFTCW